MQNAVRTERGEDFYLLSNEVHIVYIKFEIFQNFNIQDEIEMS